MREGQAAHELGNRAPRSLGDAIAAGEQEFASSNPFLTLARHCNVTYGEMMRFVDDNTLPLRGEASICARVLLTYPVHVRHRVDLIALLMEASLIARNYWADRDRFEATLEERRVLRHNQFPVAGVAPPLHRDTPTGGSA